MSRIPSLNEQRIIELSCTLYLKNDDLTGAMPFGAMDTLALPYENYLLALHRPCLSIFMKKNSMRIPGRNKAASASDSMVIAITGSAPADRYFHQIPLATRT